MLVFVNLVAFIAFAIVCFAIYATWKGSLRWAHIRTRRTAIALLIGGFTVFTVAANVAQRLEEERDSTKTASFIRTVDAEVGNYVALLQDLKDRSASTGSQNAYGKAVVLNSTKDEFHRGFMGQLGDRAAKVPEEVDLVVGVECSERQVGRYTGGGKAFQWRCMIDVAELRTRTKVGAQAIDGESPPESKLGTDDWHGDRPDGRVVDYIKSFLAK